jgi:DNA-binding CsgD family transcriptional regulator/tetratricopeptide (TPR) repeat protein
VARRLTSDQFVGRAAELRELELAADASAVGRPALILLGGDSGVGKTRLIREFERLLVDRDVLVLRGEAVEHQDGELPYTPLTSALRPLARRGDPAFGELGRGSRAQLSALLPGLEESESAPPALDPSGQVRLFEALLELLDVLSERQHVALLLEDLHWADRSTRTFVSFLARSLRQQRLLVVLTYRSDELHRRHPVRPLLSELARLEQVRRIDLPPFSRPEVTEILTDILGEAPADPLVDRLYDRGEGNALYTEELLAAGLDGRGAPPENLRDAFMLRIEQLSPDAQRAVRWIAVGRRLAEELIAELDGCDLTDLQTPLREAVAEHVLVTAEDGRLQFRHALLREVVYDDLLPGERGELHLALARALEARMGHGLEEEAELAAAVAGHYASAGDQPAALRASVQAALAARDVHAYGEAAELAERALELWPRVPGADKQIPLSRVDLLRLAATAHGVAGDRERAEVLLTRALEEVDKTAAVELYAGLLAHLSRVQWSLNRGMEAVETAEHALSLLPEGEPGPERAALMAWLARTRFLRGRFRDACADGEPALAAAIQTGDRHVEGEVLNTLGMAEIGLGQVDEGVALLERAIEISRDTDDLDNLGYAYSNLADMLNLAGRTLDALAKAQEGLAVIPQRFARLHDWLKLTVAQLAFEAGDWELMRRHLGRPAAPADRLSIYPLLVAAEVALGEGDEEAADEPLRNAEALVVKSTEPQWIGWFGALEGELRRRRFDLPGARAVVEHALGRLEVCTDDVMRIARASAVGARVEAEIARRARDLGERSQQREALARLGIHLSRLDAAAQEGGPVEAAWLASGKAELAAARGRNNAKLWREAARQWEAIDRPYYVAIMRWREAEAAVESGERAQAETPARSALASARDLGSSWLVGEVEGLARRGRLTLEELKPGPVESSPARGDGEDAPFGLTPRELQVLGLIAEGATNRQIGAALYMAEKTASVHVSRILGKLGVSSRTQAAAVAHRLHLV